MIYAGILLWSFNGVVVAYWWGYWWSRVLRCTHIQHRKLSYKLLTWHQKQRMSPCQLLKVSIWATRAMNGRMMMCDIFWKGSSMDFLTVVYPDCVIIYSADALVLFIMLLIRHCWHTSSKLHARAVHVPFGAMMFFFPLNTNCTMELVPKELFESNLYKYRTVCTC